MPATRVTFGFWTRRYGYLNNTEVTFYNRDRKLPKLIRNLDVARSKAKKAFYHACSASKTIIRSWFWSRERSWKRVQERLEARVRKRIARILSCDAVSLLASEVSFSAGEVRKITSRYELNDIVREMRRGENFFFVTM